MKKGKKKITIEIDQRLVAICEKYGVEPQKLFKHLQEDILGNRKLETYYQQILAELYFTEFISSKAKIDRSSIESVLNFTKSYQSDKNKLPEGISKLTRKLLNDCNYRKNHTKN
tara:strand:- start:89 stop:430 length:342 start_codon:yes stop_codon:yes gene_type:complete